MAKLISGRVPKLNIGISSYSENQTTLSVVGISSFSNIILNGSVSTGTTTGTSGQYLKSVGTGITWASFPTLRTGNVFTAGVAQTSFAVSYNVGFVDVYINGVRLTDSEFTGTSGTSIVLNESCFGGETVDILAYNTTSTGSGGGGGIGTESQTLNDILGLGNTSSNGMSVGVITATSFVGNLTGTATFATTAGIATYASNAGIATYATSSGIATYASNAGIATYATSAGIATYASNAGIATFATSAGIATYATNAGIATNAQGLTGTPNLNVGIVTATSFVGDGSALTGIIASGSGIVVKDSGSTVGTAGTIDFGDNLTVSAISAGIVTVTGSAGGGGSSQFVTTAAGIHTLSNVGIGTTNPTKKLTVSGDALINGLTVGLGSQGGSSNTAFGVGVLNSTGNLYNTGVGYNVLAAAAGNNNTGIGYNALTFNTSSNNTAAGFCALYDNTNGSNNTAIGYETLRYNTNGSNNTAIGLQSLYNNTFGNYNTSIGHGAGAGITTGSKNTLLGSYDGNQNGLDIRTSNNNVVLSDGDGNIRFYANSSGNVGLGTINPTSALTVSGDVKVTGIITASSFSGNATSATYATSAGIATNSQGLTGTPNISVGIITSTDSRIQSVAEKTTLVNGNTVSLVYNTGGGNIAICTNPSGDITLNVTGIPTDSTFDNYSLAFSVIVSNTGTARSCTAINLNGLSRTIKWFGGSLAAAISGVTTSNGYDSYSFTGINTVGSASTTANYIVLGSVNGSYR